MKQYKYIFLVEDDVEDQELFLEALHQIDTSIHFNLANSADEALLKLNNNTEIPDLILMDINMPGMNGISCLSEIKKDHRFDEVPIGILTTTKNPREAEEAFKQGAVFFIKKPHSFPLLVKKLKSMLLITGLYK
jgi:CheY-like chemotaxis protein